MQRNISITEFINSLGEVKDSLFQNTLKYLYNADSQSGLYIFKAQLGSGKSLLRNLLLLYRISKLATIPSSEFYAIDFFDENISLAQNGILEFLEYSNLFIKCDNETSVLENSEMDKMHIYYCSKNRNLIQFGKNVFLRFRKIKDIFQIEEADIGDSHYGLDGDSRLFITDLLVDRVSIKLKGIVINTYSPEFLPNVDFIFKKIVEEKKYKHERNVDPIQISLNPFAMLDVGPEILKELNSNLIEFNEYDTILVESPQRDFNEKKVLNIENVSLRSILSRFGYTLKKDVFPITSNFSDKVKALENALVSEKNEETLKEILADVFGLVENWDYVKGNSDKKNDYGSDQIEQIIEMRKQKNYCIFDNWDKKPEQLRVLLANQAKYLKQFNWESPEIITLGKLVALNYGRETDCCKPPEILNIIEERFCKYAKHLKEYEDSWFDEKTGLRIKVAKTSESFGKLKPVFQDIQFLSDQNPEYIKNFDTVGVLLPICLKAGEEKIGIFGTIFNGDDLI
jgi:hypothetical protein